MKKILSLFCLLGFSVPLGINTISCAHDSNKSIGGFDKTIIFSNFDLNFLENYVSDIQVFFVRFKKEEFTNIKYELNKDWQGEILGNILTFRLYDFKIMSFKISGELIEYNLHASFYREFDENVSFQDALNIVEDDLNEKELKPQVENSFTELKNLLKTKISGSYNFSLSFPSYVINKNTGQFWARR